MTKLIELNDVSVRYGACEALSHVYLDIHQQDFLGIIGPNGGGKTTLVKAILKAVPYTGKVSYSKEIESGGYRHIGYMPQISDLDKTFPISVREVVLSGLQARKKLFGRYTSADREKAENLLRICGIESVARRPIGALSGGQLQRALLGRALISDPKLLILDEPTNFVDNRFEKELYALLKQFNDKMPSSWYRTIWERFPPMSSKSSASTAMCIATTRIASRRSNCTTTTARYRSSFTATCRIRCSKSTRKTRGEAPGASPHFFLFFSHRRAAHFQSICKCR